jgi:hypothetical protein
VEEGGKHRDIEKIEKWCKIAKKGDKRWNIFYLKFTKSKKEVTEENL